MEKELKAALEGLYQAACLAHSETGRFIPPSMMGQKRLESMRSLLLEKIGIAEKLLAGQK